jgi:hypothetical protein
MDLKNETSTSDWLKQMYSKQYKTERPNYKKSNIIHYPTSTYKCCSNKLLNISYDGGSVQICENCKYKHR